MKKIVFIACLVLGMSRHVLADEWRTWRSTEIVGAATNVMVATGRIVMADIFVASGTPGGTFQYFTTTDTVVNIQRSTSIVYNVDTAGRYWVIEEALPGGFYYTATGDARIRVRWNWTQKVPVGQESRGLKTSQP